MTLASADSDEHWPQVEVETTRPLALPLALLCTEWQARTSADRVGATVRLLGTGRVLGAFRVAGSSFPARARLGPGVSRHPAAASERAPELSCRLTCAVQGGSEDDAHQAFKLRCLRTPFSMICGPASASPTLPKIHVLRRQPRRRARGPRAPLARYTRAGIRPNGCQRPPAQLGQVSTALGRSRTKSDRESAGGAITATQWHDESRIMALLRHCAPSPASR